MARRGSWQLAGWAMLGLIVPATVVVGLVMATSVPNFTLPANPDPVPPMRDGPQPADNLAERDARLPAFGNAGFPAWLAASTLHSEFNRGFLLRRPPRVPTHVFPQVALVVGSAAAAAQRAQTSQIAMLERQRDELAGALDRLHRQRSEELARVLPPVPVVPIPVAPAPVAPVQNPAQVPPGPVTPVVVAPVVEPPPATNTPGEKALQSLPDRMPPRVLLRYARGSAEARRRAEGLAAALKARGIQVTDLRDSAGLVRTALNFFYVPDEALAREVASLAGVTAARRPLPKESLLPRPGTIEIGLTGS